MTNNKCNFLNFSALLIWMTYLNCCVLILFSCTTTRLQRPCSEHWKRRLKVSRVVFMEADRHPIWWFIKGLPGSLERSRKYGWQKVWVPWEALWSSMMNYGPVGPGLSASLWNLGKVQVSIWANWSMIPEVIPVSIAISMKRLGVFLLPPGWDAIPSQGYPQHKGG